MPIIKETEQGYLENEGIRRKLQQLNENSMLMVRKSGCSYEILDVVDRREYQTKDAAQIETAFVG